MVSMDASWYLNHGVAANVEHDVEAGTRTGGFLPYRTTRLVRGAPAELYATATTTLESELCQELRVRAQVARPQLREVSKQSCMWLLESGLALGARQEATTLS